MKKNDNGQYIVWSVKNRITHIILFLSVGLALLTGIPLKYHEFSFSRPLYNFFGSYGSISFLHLAVGIVIILVFIYHLISIGYIWITTHNFFKKSELMFSKKDFRDLIDLFLFFAFIKKKPQYGTYSVFQKLDYFVPIICMLLIAFSGIIIAFPVAMTSFISTSWLPISHHLHSSVSILFIVFVLMSHMYNSHIHPDKLYFNTVWLTGTLDEAEMKLLHPFEYKRILQGEVDIRETYRQKANEESKANMIKQEKKKLEDYLKEGNEFARDGKYADAIGRYKEAIKIYPNYHQARFNLGIVYKKAKKYAEAIGIFNEFIEMDQFNKMVSVAKKHISELTELVQKTADHGKVEKPEDPETISDTGVLEDLDDYGDLDE